MMKKVLRLIPLLALLMPLMGLTIPRVYVQKLILDNGKNPFITWDQGKSAKEYHLKVWINTRPDEIVTTDKNPIHTVGIKQVGDGKKFPFTVIASLNLGNFPSQWQAGEIIHLELKHIKTGQKVSWKMPIPAGTALIKQLDKPITIPPFSKKNKK